MLLETVISIVCEREWSHDQLQSGAHLEWGVGDVAGAALAGRLGRAHGQDGEDAGGAAAAHAVGRPAHQRAVVKLGLGAVLQHGHRPGAGHLPRLNTTGQVGYLGLTGP